ncbi:ATP-dependent RNA helicase SUV3 [Aspergillus egyptiacus]|nr:ATP-dependent RNA helicase SUV3 [Aspergillus egyptiacus]
MLQWTRKGSHRLICTLKAPSSPPARCFTTTATLWRGKSQIQRLKEKQRKQGKSGVSLDVYRHHAPRSMRRNIPAGDFHAIVQSALEEVKETKISSRATDEEKEFWGRFERYVTNACRLKERSKIQNAKSSSLQHVKATLQEAYLKSGEWGLKTELDYLVYAYEINSKYSAPNLEQQKKIADFRYPAEWYPQARATQRTIHLHVGPTNSGKTYHALQRLQASKGGFYAGPLRLLAQEVYHRFHSTGIPCSLVTGDDVKIPEGQRPVITSNTVEMVNLGRQYEVGVIDEIQMISDPKRGWAWTRAVLGARATELHLCGEARAVPLIREIAALTGDKLEIHRYERLNPLKVMDRSLKGDLKKLQKGDCVVSFSRVGIHALKNDIEKVTGRRAAVVYGGLPAEIRTQQASLFNDPDNDYDFLVASDAIGMGLNLSCKRIIFETIVKRSSEGLAKLTVPEIKQIAGRAGRYRSAAQQGSNGTSRDDGDNVGYVTSLEDIDLPYIREAMGVEPPPLKAAGIIFPDSALEKFAAYFPQNVPLEYLMRQLAELATVHPLFFMCNISSPLQNAEVIDAVTGLQIADQLTFMAAPIHVREAATREVAMAYARCIAENSNGRLLDIPELNLEVLEQPVSGNKEYLGELEALHKSVILYNWLSFRIGGIFTDRTLAVHVKELVEERMVRALTEFSANKKLRKDASLRRQIALQKQIYERQRLLNEAQASDGPDPAELPDDGLVASGGAGASEGPDASNSITTGTTADDEEATEIDLVASEDYEEKSASRVSN